MLYPLRDWTVLRVGGRDAARFLHNFCTANVKALQPGQGCEAFFTNVKARIVGHGLICRDGVLGAVDDNPVPSFTVFADAGHRDRLAAHLDRYLITEQVTIADDSAGTALWRVHSATLVKPSLATDLGRLSTSVERLPTGRVSLHHLQGISGLDCIAEANVAMATTCEAWLIDTGGSGTRSSDIEYEHARIAAIWPRYGVDISEEHLAPEADRPWAINLNKGCYLGQEPIARIDAMGHVNRQLRGLRLDEPGDVPVGTQVLLSGVLVGTVSSSVTAHGETLALAMLRTKAAVVGTRLALSLPNDLRNATVYNAVPAE